MALLDILFLVQGEGRGHLTQALALRERLEAAGHRVAAVLAGCSRSRRAPTFFLDAFDVPVVCLDSPNFVTGRARRGIRWAATFGRALGRLPRYHAALRRLGAALDRYRPDVVVNFYEPLGGLYYALHRPSVPMVCVAHQYLYLHPAHRFPPGRRLPRLALRTFTRLTAFGAARRLALSLYPLAPPPGEAITVVPPLLRKALFAQPQGAEEAFFLVYLLNHGYAADVERWHARHPGVPLHVFWDHPAAAPVERRDPTLTFHRLDGTRFLELMARCRGLVTTAGFESVAEAMYLGKPVLAIPVEGHFEQFCNSRDAVRAGAGIARTAYDLDALLAYLPHYESPAPRFRAWLEEGHGRIVEAIEAAAGVQRAAPVAAG
ncbi:MAG: glycosyltransferase family protein [Rhodothermales bacterium]|nr:glycosyltransferase family protein [Rhodothermales bacterium]